MVLFANVSNKACATQKDIGNAQCNIVVLWLIRIKQVQSDSQVNSFIRETNQYFKYKYKYHINK